MGGGRKRLKKLKNLAPRYKKGPRDLDPESQHINTQHIPRSLRIMMSVKKNVEMGRKKRKQSARVPYREIVKTTEESLQQSRGKLAKATKELEKLAAKAGVSEEVEHVRHTETATRPGGGVEEEGQGGPQKFDEMLEGESFAQFNKRITKEAGRALDGSGDAKVQKKVNMKRKRYLESRSEEAKDDKVLARIGGDVDEVRLKTPATEFAFGERNDRPPEALAKPRRAGLVGGKNIPGAGVGDNKKVSASIADMAAKRLSEWKKKRRLGIAK
eukprot:TRINITY_DN286_c0_g1_i1.p2 TRINITY_DN286_c0_g1~~TRINITY_DN286_c0_g1_i1.p2  ORF type:complete len:285 (+),score=77.83 TRINITY_DN286_c0_g1_i1:44-856(+)